MIIKHFLEKEIIEKEKNRNVVNVLDRTYNRFSLISSTPLKNDGCLGLKTHWYNSFTSKGKEEENNPKTLSTRDQKI